MKKLALGLLVLALCILVFWWGLLVNFPGEALSRMIAAQIEQSPVISAKIQPAQLRWNRIEFPEMSFLWRREGSSAPLVSLKDLSIPLSWGLLKGVRVSAALGREGRLEIFLPWSETELTVSGSGLRMEEIPAFRLFRPIRVGGKFAFEGAWKKPNLRGKVRIPEGFLTSTGENLSVENIEWFGIKFPAPRLESVELRIKTGNRIEVKKGTFRGDIQGSIGGFISPQISAPRRSVLRLKITAAFRQDWLQRLGNLRPLLEERMNAGRLQVGIQGTLERPVFRTTAGRG